MTLIVGNMTHYPDDRVRFSTKFSGLRRDRDNRPKCILLTGDGFTQGLLNATGLNGMFPCQTSNLFRESNSIRYIPLVGDKFADSPLLTKDKWQKVWDICCEHEFDCKKVLHNIGDDPDVINPAVEGGGWTIDESHLGFELRWYLWYFFRNGASLINSILERISNWDWTQVIRHLVNEYQFSYASFNYDAFFDSILRQALNVRPYMILRQELEPLNQLTVNVVPIMCLHGSINLFIRREPLHDTVPNPWLSDRRNKSVGCFYPNKPVLELPMSALGQAYALQDWPWLPDLVPPGQKGTDRCLPDASATRYAKTEIQSCDLLVVCGLSANEPDTDEIRELVLELRPEAKVVHIDQGNPANTAPIMAQLLSNQVSDYTGIGSDEVSKIPELLAN